jgi:importin subunit beta-1
MQYLQILSEVQSNDAHKRVHAEYQLKYLEETQFSQFLFNLATLLAQKEHSLDSRRLASYVIKNALDSKDKHRRVELRNRYLEQSEDLRNHIKNLLLSVLNAEETSLKRGVVQVISKIAAVELPMKQWREIIPSLITITQSTNPKLHQSGLEAIGYVCEELSSDGNEHVLCDSEINQILTAVVQGMKDSNSHTQLVSVRALLNSLEFCRVNFERENECDYILQVVCANCKNSDPEVRQVSFECVSEIATLYYHRLPKYIEAFYDLTIDALLGESEEYVALQSIELWSSIADKEITVIDEAKTSTIINKTQCHYFIQKAAPFLVPVLLEQLTKQDDIEHEEVSWNLPIASATCISLISRCIGNYILPLVLPYVENNISIQEDWQRREAAAFAMGAILQGPAPTVLKPLLDNCLENILLLLKDRNSMVRDSAAFTISRALEFIHNSSISFVQHDRNLQKIFDSLALSVGDESRIAARSCEAIMHLVKGFEKSNDILNPYFQKIMSVLLNAAIRNGYHNNSLELTAYEAINETIRHAPVDCIPMVEEMLSELIIKLREALSSLLSTNETSEIHIKILGYMCGAIQVIFQKFLKAKSTFTLNSQTTSSTNSLMELLLMVLNFQSSAVQEEALLAVSGLCNIMNKEFNKYMQALYPYLECCLKKHHEPQICFSAVGVLGDICLAIKTDFTPYIENIMNILWENCASSSVHRKIKPAILSTFGDIAFAVGDAFIPYIDTTMQMLTSAAALSNKTTDSFDEELFEYNKMLRNGIFEAFSGMLHGICHQAIGVKLQFVAPQVLVFVLQAVKKMENQPNQRDDGCIQNALGLILDVADHIHGSKVAFMQLPDLLMIVIKIANQPTFSLDCRKKAFKTVKAMFKAN